jgi:hypothetical protein
MQKNSFFLAFILMLGSAPWNIIVAQELTAEVSITTPKLQETDPVVFKTLERDLKEFLNQTHWTNDEYKSFEKIDCNFSINITSELGGNTFKADIALKAIRPVYGSEYKTVLINHVDRDVTFLYQEFQPIENGTEFFKDNLSAVFSYYVQLILGLDAGSFAPDGGAEHFQIAQNIINQIPSAVSEADKGWQSLNRKTTRYWIMENLLSPRFVSFNEAWYNYHRKGLDIMASNPTQAVATMVDALSEIDRTNKAYPNSIGILMFLTAKSDEIVAVMKNGTRTQQTAVYDIMRRLDPANTGKYNAIRG